MQNLIPRLLKVFFFLIILFYSDSIYSQSAIYKSGKSLKIDSLSTQINIEELELTTTLLQDQSYRDIKFGLDKLKKKLSKKPIRKKANSYELESFYVRNVFNQSLWDSTEAMPVFSNELITVWIQKSAFDTLENTIELNELISGLERLLLHETPIQSIDSSKGILEILKEYAGEFPNVDSDGVLDVLLLDINDQFESTGSYIAGFFDPINLIEHRYSNERDLIYLDLYPTIFRDNQINIDQAGATLIHEAQHLIHAKYEGTEIEEVFLNESYSEGLEVIAGFPIRDNRAFTNSPPRSLLSWNYKNSLPDYARAALWANYLIEQYEPSILKFLIQNSKTGIDGLQDVLKNVWNNDFESLFTDWGKALALNEVSNNYRFSYKHPSLKNKRLLNVETQVDFYPQAFNIYSPALSHTLVNYSLTNDLTLHSEITSNYFLTPIYHYPNLEYYLGNTSVANIVEYSSNDYQHSSIAILHSNLEKNQKDILNSFLAEGYKSGNYYDLNYDDGEPDIFYRNASYLILEGKNKGFGVLFTPGEKDTWLESLNIRTVFLSELIGSGVDSKTERDFEVEIYSIKNNNLSNKLLPTIKLDSKRESGVLINEGFSFREYYDDLKNIPDSIYVLIKNDDDDENYVAIGLDNSTESHSYILDNSIKDKGINFSEYQINNKNLDGWNLMVGLGLVYKPFSTIDNTSSIQPVLDLDKVLVSVIPEMPGYDKNSVSLSVKLPNGAFWNAPLESIDNDQEYKFKIPAQVDGEYTFYSRYTSKNGKKIYLDNNTWQIDIPNGFVLNQNYPNPFNPSTNIPFYIVESANVGWEVYDVLGRKVKEIPPSLFQSGEHIQQLKLSGMATGMYFVRAKLSRENGKNSISKVLKIMYIK